MIKNITIENFQSHKKTELELHKNVNVIIGESNKGKSAIVRALNWLINNKPSGDAYRSKWGGNTEIEIDLDNGHEHAQVTRLKNDKDNMYILGVHDEYKAFGQGVPEDITKILNMSEINIQYQLDQHFLLSKSDGEVIRYFNKIVDLEIIDKSLKNVDKKYRKAKSNKEHQDEEYNDLVDELKSYEWIDDAENELKLLENKEKVLTDKINLYNTIVDYEEQYEHLLETISAFQIDFDEAEQYLDKLEKLQYKIGLLKEEKFTIKELFDQYGKSVDLGKSKIMQIKKLQDKYKDLLGDVCPICESKIKR